MEVEAKCPFWEVCGPAPIHQRLARRAFPYGDPRRDYKTMVCNDKNRYLECKYYKIRIKPPEGKEMSQPPLPIFGTIRVICGCGVKNERGLENALIHKYPQKCEKCGQKCLIRFEPFDPDGDVDAT